MSPKTDNRRTVRIGIISDTHGFLDPRIADLITQCEMTVHAGDIMDARILDEMRPRSGNVIAVRGNNDVPGKCPGAAHQRLHELPLEARIDLPGGKLVVVHGHHHWSPSWRHDRLRASFPDARAIVYGHSHRMAEDCADNPWVLNPGAAGRIRTFGGPSCLVLVAAPRTWSVETHRFPLLNTHA